MTHRLRNKYLLIRAIPKSLYFNLKYFPLREALRFPIIVSHRTVLERVEGEVEIVGAKRRGMIRIGFGSVGTLDQMRTRPIWAVSGKVVFNGCAFFGYGSRISVNDKGVLSLGDGFMVTGDAAIICSKKMSFGRGCLVSWDVQIMDTDFHRIEDVSSRATLNEDREVDVGESVWIGCKCLVLKGTRIGNGCVVGANTMLNSHFEDTNSVIAGNPAAVVRTNVRWFP